ncbi:calmodulin-binding transcription activator 1 isoform X4 [Scophthalmus maximus]|uniref:calmodulin-binding transcription activator 1 isoform X4 n=1 Tax=Scophthalmus maximus TaxID=52904 RepID=UPI001FA8C03E|nr:calmodulin-binding transcription activator 1 isoform X4 [Scophthalmus maximus]
MVSSPRSDRLAAAAPLPPPRSLLELVLAVHARGTHGREEEEDVAREGEMAAENKPEGLKKVRNPDRMYRSAVCYAGHGPPKSISDDTEMNNEHGHLKIYLPKKLLECLPKCTSLPKERHRWNTNEEIAAYLITFEKHEEWLTTSPKTRPQNGSMILYNRKKVKYRKDGYCWKKRKDGKTTREDHMKLKVQGVECLYGCYVHSSIIPTFHRRCYWLLQNPDIVLVHYLNVPAIEDCGKPCGPILCSINTDKKEWAKWTKEELIGQLKPMFHGIKWTCSNGNSSSGFSVEQLVQQILDSHQTKPPPRTHNCLCTGTLGAGSSVHHKCNSAKHRIISPKVDPRSGGYSSAHSEVQNNDVSEGKTEHSGHGGGKSSGGGGGGSAREKRNGKVHKPVLLHQNSTEVSSTNQVEVPDTTQNSPVSISSGLNSDPDMADSPAVTGMSHVASVMSGLSQSVFMSEVTGDPVYSMSPTGGPNTHLMGADAASQGLVLSDRHKFAFPSAGVGEAGSTAAGDSLSMMSAAGVSEELVLSSSLDSGSIKIPETNMNFDPDCFLNNPKQGQTYGGSAMKTEGNSSSASSSSGGSGNTNGGLQRSPNMADNGYTFNSALVKNIKTEDTSFEQQLATESGYQVGAVVNCGSGVSVAPAAGPGQGSLSLGTAGSLLPSGGGLSPSTTLEQMDFSAIDAKQEYTSNTNTVSYAQAMSSPHMQHQNRSPSFFLQDASQPGQGQQGRPGMGQKTHMMEHNSHDSGAYMGLQVVKTDSPGSNGHLHHHHQGHQTQHRANCNGGSPTEGPGQAGSLQLLQYQGTFPGLGAEHEEVVGLEQPGSVSSAQAGAAENGAENLLKPGDHIQACGAGNGEGGGAEHYLQQASDGGGGGGNVGAGEVAIHNGNNNNDGSNRPQQQQQQQQQLQPLLQGASMVQGLYNAVGGHQGLGGGASNGGAGGTGMEISLDHFDISFGNQFSDLINDFISVDGSGAAMSAGGALYAHQLVASHGSDGQNAAGGPPQQGQEDGGARGSGYGSSELCLQPCCSPQSLSGGAGAAGNAGDAGSLSYMNVAEVVSAAVAQGALGMLQATGRLFMVTDYSPEWSYPEGGVKVLITGPWQEASSNYSCLFDQISVPASLIQPGVLRCYCPAHDTGLVTLQVAASNQIISSSVVFEYKARALPSLPSSQHDWLSLDDNQFRMSILERLEQMERRMAEMASHQQPGGAGSGGAGGGTGGAGGGGGGGGGGTNSQSQCVSGQMQAGSSFESRVVVVCEKMMSRACWAKSKHLIHSKTFRGMTLLHLAAGQGYATLIQTLIKWRTKHADSIDLELEVDPLNVDHFSCTPLMWACALGHLEAAVVLYKWDRRALAIPDSLGRLPLSIARSRGHTKLAECLEQLQREEQQTPAPLPPTSRMSFSPGPEAPTADSWMVSWANDGVVAPGSKKGGAATSTAASGTAGLNPDLRRPRSEPSNYYSGEGQRDLPLAKKHKPNHPELSQTRPDKAVSVPLSLEQQQLHRPSPKSLSSEGLSSDKGLSTAGCAGTVRWTSREGGFASGGGGLGRKAPGVGGGSGLGKEKLVNRLRQREQLGMLVMADREMADAELLSYREDLENQDCLTQMDDLQVNMMTLAEHIIEATPERIKRENFTPADSVPLDTSGVSNTMNWLANYLGDVEQLPSIIHLRSLYNEPLTPSSNPSLSPGGSPLREAPLDRSALPSPADWSEFIGASNSKVERDLAQLTLSDPEQRELYEAARLVQTAFRKYKGRPLREQQEVAAAVIQRCYKKYKQYALYKKMTQAAILIQSKFRSYHEQKKFQQSRRAAVLIQQYYRSYKEFGRLKPHRRGAAAALVQHKLRGSLLTKRQDQAARKIMRFLRRCRHRVRELKRAREHETPQTSPLAM